MSHNATALSIPRIKIKKRSTCFFHGPLALGPRVTVLTLMQSLRLQSGSTDAADVHFRSMCFFSFLNF